MLNKKGIDKLEAIMLANKDYWYDQQDFAASHNDSDGHACGTELCAAGFSRLLAVGPEQFNEEAKRHVADFVQGFATNCIFAGIELLGLQCSFDDDTYRKCPKIFDSSYKWPDDLSAGYRNSKTNEDRIHFYIKMLRTRANSDGTLTKSADEPTH